MNKEQFVLALYDELRGLPIEDVERSIAYYREMIDERVEDGMSEEEAVAALGSVQEIAEQIRSEIPLKSLVREKVTGGRKMPGWEIALLILGAPLWFSFGVTALSLLFAAFVVLWSLAIALFATMGGLAAAAVAALPAGVMAMLRSGPAQGIFVIGSGFVCGGFAVMLFLAATALSRGTAKVSGRFWLWIKSLFVRKEAA